jgi:hypothetical protein
VPALHASQHLLVLRLLTALSRRSIFSSYPAAMLATSSKRDGGIGLVGMLGGLPPAPPDR